MGADAFGLYRHRIQTPVDRTSDDGLWMHILQQLETVHHPVGTCKMRTGALAVVDADLRVRSVEGLRIVDASIMPTVISGNTNAAYIMIGEKGADLILGKKTNRVESSVRSGV